MISFKIFLFVFSFFYIVRNMNGAFTEKQLESAKRMIMNICRPRTNVTEEDFQTMRSGKFEETSREAKCFMNCVLVSNKWQNKDNTFNEAGSIASVKMLPENLQGEAKRVINVCKDSAKSLNDKCVSAMEISKCFFENSEEIRKFMA